MEYFDTDYNELISHNGFRYKRNDWKIMSVLNMVDDGLLTIQPNFRTHQEWRHSQRSNFIESLFLGMPVGNIICEENPFGELTVLDGTQRLKSIIEFLNNEFMLKDLSLLKHLNNKKFEDLYYNDSSLLRNRLTLTFINISYDTHPLLKFEFFKRINYGQHRFPIQSARNYAFPHTKHLIDELKKKFTSKVSFEKKLFPRSKSELSFSTDIDQFFLYLILIVSLELKMLEITNNDETVLDVLDKCAFLHNERKYDSHLIVGDVFNQFRKIILSFDFLKEIIVTMDEDVLYDNITFNKFMRNNIIQMSMGKFIHVFIHSMKSSSEGSVAEMIYDSDTLIPEYFEMRKKSRFLNKEIFGRNYDSRFRD